MCPPVRHGTEVIEALSVHLSYDRSAPGSSDKTDSTYY